MSRRLAEACEVAAFSREKKQIYEEEKMNEWDIQAQKEYAVREGREEGRKEGFEKGHAEGHAEGLAEGRIEGRTEGLAEGEAKANARVAKSMLRENMPIEQITRLTGLSESEVMAL